MIFWTVTLPGTAATVLLLVRPLMCRQRAAAPRAAYDKQVFRDQLREVERDAARGALSEIEAEAARIEVSRRLLAAATASQAQTAAAPARRALSTRAAAALAIAMPAIAVLIYLQVGAPGERDEPLAKRIEQARAERENRLSQVAAEARAEKAGAVVAPSPRSSEDSPDFTKLVRKLEEALKQTPDDPRGLSLLGRSYAQLGRYGESWRMYARAAKVLGEQSTGDLLSAQGEAMTFAAGGYISPEAEDVFNAALSKNPSQPRARFYLAESLAQQGAFPAAIKIWSDLIAGQNATADWADLVRARIREASAAIGAPPLPAAGSPLPGPGAADIEAARDMSPKARAAMINGMVDRLAARLGKDPADLEGWLRLIRSYGALGRPEDAQAAAAKARETFADSPAALKRIARSAASDADADPVNASGDSAPANASGDPDAAKVTPGADNLTAP